MNINADMIEKLIAHLRTKKDYGDFVDFNHETFLKEERNYKLATIDKAKEQLSREELRRLLDQSKYDEIINRMDAIGKDNNMLWRSLPMKGNLSYLYQPNLNKPEFCQAAFDFLYGEGESPERLDHFVAYMDSAGMKCNWTFPTYFLFICHPDTDVFIKPTVIKEFLDIIGQKDLWSTTPNGQTYGAILDIAQQLKKGLEPYGARDMVDVQSFMWVCVRQPPNGDGGMSPEKRKQLDELFKEFLTSYPATEVGIDHIERYKTGRKEAQEIYKEAKSRDKDSEDFTDFVLFKMLPNKNNPKNRERGAWIHVAPMFPNDIKQFLLGKGFSKDDQNRIARGIYDFILKCIEFPDELDEACAEFSGNFPNMYIHSAMLSPFLNAIRPDSFVIINSKPRDVLNYFTASKYTGEIADYPAANQGALQFIDEIKDLLKDNQLKDMESTDAFDMFTHWAVSEKKILPEANGDDEYTIEKCAEDTGFTVNDLNRWVNAIHRKGQAIIYGPPGTGKTFLAEKLAQHIIGGNYGFTELVQFHPEYAYQDFMQGIRPETTADGNLTYKNRKGRFIDFCEKARQLDGDCVLIIDEINRANLSQVFGELMYLLEYRDQAIPLAGGGFFKIPNNVRIIGTMNTADRSIALVDFALRRRFAFIKLWPNYDILRKFIDDKNFDIKPLINTLEAVNNEIDKDHQIGVTFFLRENLINNIEDIWRMEIEPYLEEYFFDRPETADKFHWDKVADSIMPRKASEDE